MRASFPKRISTVALLEGTALLEQFSEAKISDPKVLALARRVEVVVMTELSRL
jgi:2-methylcitrate dehydratase PrpD